MTSAPKVTTVGGGTGTFSVITALRSLRVDLACVVAVSDSGGSTGRIRDEFGFGAVGDLRQSLAALASEHGQEWIQRLLLYRFAKGKDLKGHNLGNLILTALQDMSGSTTQALEVAERIFRLTGSVIPITEDSVNLQINYQDGSSTVGEHVLDENQVEVKPISGVKLVPDCHLNPVARDILISSNLIIIGPGDYYASLHAVLAVPGVKDTFANSKAKIVYIVNLMTRKTQTHGMTASDHLKGIEKAIGRSADYVLINNGRISDTILKLYAEEGEFPVVDDLGPKDKRVRRANLITQSLVDKSPHDTAYRSLLRHNPVKLRSTLRTLIYNEGRRI